MKRKTKVNMNAVMVFLGLVAVVTAVATYLGVTPTVELQVLFFINISVLSVLLLWKSRRFPITRNTAGGSTSSGTRWADTAWFVAKRLGLRKLPPEKTSDADGKPDGPEKITGAIVQVVETIDKAAGTGKVKYKGILWRAVAKEIIREGDDARIMGRDVLTLQVEKVKEKRG